MLVLIIVLAVLAVIYLFLVAPRMINKPDRSKLMGVHYAHRGLFDNDSDAPENSLNAIRKAVEAGYGIEFDIQLSKDDVPVIFHDASLKRMCGVDGKIWDYTLEELQKMKLADSDQTIPTLMQVLEVVDGKVPLIIEYKMDRVDTKVCELGNAILENYKGVYCMESFHPFAVKWYREHRPDVVRGQLSQDFSKTDYKGIQYWAMTHLLLNFLTRPDFIAYNHKDADKFSRRLCTQLGALSVAWTIKNRKQYEDAKPYFDLVIFDSFIP
ncbi:MAG: glycerophosphodiester phosphodiesterase [Tyzzerella sp.]|nr:glycerophosphodiester phosphodiesterase [Tyzzerella sp.]